MKVINTTKAPQAIGPYSQAIATDNLLFCSGQIGINPTTNELEQGLEAQAQQIFKNIEAVLHEAGTTITNVVKTTIFITNISEFAKVNELYSNFFQNHKPARSTVEVSNLPKGAIIEIEIIAKIA